MGQQGGFQHPQADLVALLDPPIFNFQQLGGGPRTEQTMLQSRRGEWPAETFPREVKS
jgi:hypothetical protein